MYVVRNFVPTKVIFGFELRNAGMLVGADKGTNKLVGRASKKE